MLLTDFNATTPQSRVVKNMLRAVSTLDLNNAGQFISKDFKYQTFPKDDDLPVGSKAVCMERYEVIFSLFKKVEYDIHEVIEAPGKVIIHYSAVSETHDGDKIDYDSLSIYTLIEEDGELKIIGCKDFSDPEKREFAYSWAAKALAKRAT